MALRRCWRFSGLVPRLLWRSPIPPGSSIGGRSTSVPSFVNTYRCYKSTGVRWFGSQLSHTDVSYEQLKQLLDGQKTVVIDVREPWELREYGFIPGSINVPLGHVITALQLDPDEFREKYDAELPQQTDNIVFICLAGVRSKSALITAASLGYKQVQHYPGGWQEWMERETHQ
uniref:Sulfurtransferase n=2 Tax=Nothobranchius kuhntae TaxID=321403 RepID=A0A1A8J8Q4_NOTKU